MLSKYLSMSTRTCQLNNYSKRQTPSPEEVLPSPVNYEDFGETGPMGKYKMRTVCPTAQFMVGVRFLIYYKIKLKKELRNEFFMLN